MEANIIAHAWLTPENFSFVCSTGGGMARSAPQIEAGARFRNASASPKHPNLPACLLPTACDYNGLDCFDPLVGGRGVGMAQLGFLGRILLVTPISFPFGARRCRAKRSVCAVRDLFAFVF
jgi:hypothetical protein